MEEKVSMDLPAKFNLFDMVTVRPYKDSPEYKERKIKFLQKVETKKKTKRTVNIVLWLMLAAYLVYLFFTGHTFLFWVAGILGAIICGIISFNNSPNDVSSYLDTSKEDEETLKKVINELIENNFPGSRYIYSWGKALIYNNDVFAYISVNENLLIVYSRDNFRQLDCKEIQGSHGYGDQYEYSTSPGSSTVGIRYLGKGYGKELQVEISTNYLEYPIIKFTVPFNKKFDEEIKIVGNVLS